jgi:hypothetical protein
MARQRTRRDFLADSGRLGLAAAGFAIAGPGALSLAKAQALVQPASVTVLMAEVPHTYGQLTAYRVTGDGPGWRISPIIETSFAFTHVALHWNGAPLRRVEVRTSRDAMHWSPWESLPIEGGVQDGGACFTALLGADRDGFVQYRLPAAAPLPERLALTYLNSLDGPRRPLAQVRRPAEPGKGQDLRDAIITREEWGADESIRFSRDGTEDWERTYVAPRAVVVHHTATTNSCDDPAADVRAIYALHTITREWGDLGYHALIDAEGRIYEGRMGRDTDPFGRFPRDVLSFGVVSAHAFTFNYGSTSVALIGDFEEAEPPPAAWRALEEYLVYAHRRYAIDPRTTLDFARSNETWRYDFHALSGHRDCGTVTECPGEFVYRRLPELRERVAERIIGGATIARAIVDAPPDRDLWPGPASYRWQGAQPADLVFDGFWKPPENDVVDYRGGYNAAALPTHIFTRETQTGFLLDAPGQYTLHVRPADQPFADRLTVVVQRQVVRDNADADGVHRTEGWTRSRRIVHYHGSDYEQANPGSYAELTWELPVPESGRYHVQACWPSAEDHTRAAPYTVAVDGATLTTMHADQSKGNGAWATLGTFDLVEGQLCTVTVTAPADGAGVVVADAARIVRES